MSSFIDKFDLEFLNWNFENLTNILKNLDYNGVKCLIDKFNLSFIPINNPKENLDSWKDIILCFIKKLNDERVNSLNSNNDLSINKLTSPHDSLPKRKNKKKNKVTPTIYVANSGKLLEKDLKGFKAAGILPMRITPNGVELLLAVEYRGKNLEINLLGGQYNKGESPIQTAKREFIEETSECIPIKDLEKMLSNSQTIWIGLGKYVLWVGDSTNIKSVDRCPENYFKLFKKKFGAEANYISWVNWSTLLNSINSSNKLKINVGNKKKLYPLSVFLKRLMNEESFVSIISKFSNERKNLIIENCNSSLNELKIFILNELKLIEKQYNLSDQKFYKDVIHSNEEKKLEAPKFFLSYPIVSIQSTDEFNKVINYLPQEQKHRVKSVRKINTLAREAIYKNEFNNNDNKGEIFPLFHGTPERWRATAIAIHGFDLNIKLNGRSLGDGIYTSTSIRTSFSYINQNGSILIMKGINNKSNTERNIQDSEKWIVFKKPEQLLPKYIIDFSDPTKEEADKLKNEKIINQKQEEFKEKKSKFKESLLLRSKKCLNIYKNQLIHYNDILENLDDLSKINELIKRLKIEKNQFSGRLPIYSKKDIILDHFKEYDVTIIIANTGSGKSTQIPQYLLDNTFDENDSRSIAVLQPRRVNAISLAKRVSLERDSDLGDEVGYRIGLGDNCVSENTKIDFMTHGLFVQIAQNPKTLLNRYSAVIVDEAHERSIEVDFSLALLKQALEENKIGNKSTSNEPKSNFKVIIMSATIEEQAKNFKKFFSNSNTSIITIQEETYPVIIENRPEVLPDKDVVGTDGVGKILSSSALQMALDLIALNSDGNALVFLPSESTIRFAMYASYLYLKKSEPMPSEEDGFSFTFYPENGNKSKGIKIGIYPFYGKMPKISRDNVLNSNIDRMIIFSTNVAETGLTIPNIRYVIDTGLERRVQFNNELQINEMVTDRITKSSMNQRTGRAGRVGTGICIRLYSESIENELKLTKDPEITTKNIQSAVLRLKDIEQTNNKNLDLLTSIPEEDIKKVTNTLKLLKAIENDKVSEIGKSLLALGIDLKLACFLIACRNFGCLESGSKLAAILVNDSSDKLLPKNNSKNIYKETISDTGDHMTLLNIFKSHEKSLNKLSWYNEHDIDSDLFDDIDKAFSYITDKLSSLGYLLEDNQEIIKKQGGLERSILRALCVGYMGQFAIPCMPGKPNRFIWMMEEEDKQKFLISTSKFVKSNAPIQNIQNSNYIQNIQNNQSIQFRPSIQNIQYTHSIQNIQNNYSMNQEEEQQLKLGNRSVLWHLSEDKDNQNLAIFCTANLTDNAKKSNNDKSGIDIPTIYSISWLTQDDILEASKLVESKYWYKITLKELINKNKRKKSDYIMNEGDANSLFLKDQGAWMKELRNKFPSAQFLFSKDKKTLTLSCSQRLWSRIDSKIKNRLRLARETITISILNEDEKKIFIGQNGNNLTELRNGLNQIICYNLGTKQNVDKDTVYKSSDGVDICILQVKDLKILLTLGGCVKTLMSILFGKIKSNLNLINSNISLDFGNGSLSKEIIRNPRLYQMSSNILQFTIKTRNDIMAKLVHSAIWNLGCSVYGGYVRDWIIRGEDANDIDIRVPNGINSSIVATNLINVASQIKVRLIREEKLQAIHKLYFRPLESTEKDIGVDLVPENLPKNIYTPPGVDCDVGNFCISKEGLRRKNPQAGKQISICDSIEHAINKQFVFFYDIQDIRQGKRNLDRLIKYFQRGWTCLNAISHPNIQQYRHLIKPKEIYNKDWTKS